MKLSSIKSILYSSGFILAAGTVGQGDVNPYGALSDMLLTGGASVVCFLLASRIPVAAIPTDIEVISDVPVYQSYVRCVGSYPRVNPYTRRIRNGKA